MIFFEHCVLNTVTIKSSALLLTIVKTNMGDFMLYYYICVVNLVIMDVDRFYMKNTAVFKSRISKPSLFANILQKKIKYEVVTSSMSVLISC